MEYKNYIATLGFHMESGIEIDHILRVKKEASSSYWSLVEMGVELYES